MKSNRPLIIFLSWLGLAQGAYAEEIEGVIRNSGSGVNQMVEVVPGKATGGQRLCTHEGALHVKKLSGMTLQITGDWKMDKAGKRQCFAPSAFKIRRHISGRPPLVGVVNVEEAVFVLTDEDGKKHVLGEVSAGLRKLAGKKVILDVKPIVASSQQESLLKVISYSTYPE